jgi:hypothetical protein
LPQRRRTTIAAAAVCAAAVAVAPAPAPAAVAKTCDKLTGTKVVTTPQIKIVRRNVREIPKRIRPNVSRGGFIGRAFYGCSLPQGNVRRIGSGGTTYLYERRNRRGGVRRISIYSRSSESFSSPTGTYVLQESSDGVFGGPGAGTYNTGLVRNLATGERYAYWAFDPYDQGDFSPVAPMAFKLTEQGVLAGIFDAQEGATARTVRAFSAAGRQTILDSVPPERANDIPADSLGLTGTTVTWTNAGQAKSADVPQ